ncbi:MAG TPA: bifunctional nicotinamidase/pyrazinamidase [Rhabdochlamydiaceae bacterium]|jgi:nicotinamidase/pyrazinamidase
MNKGLLIVDMQNDFMSKGALGVPGAEELIPLINQLVKKFSLVVASQDWHPLDHVSFAKNHPGKKVGDVISVKHQDQVLWPVHCVRQTKGAQLVTELHKESIACYFYKGTDTHIDGYSAFFDNAHVKSTGLGDYLKNRHIKEIFLAGVATDYCVLHSTLDAIELGFCVFVIADACRAINLHRGDEERAFVLMREKGAKIVNAYDVLKF